MIDHLMRPLVGGLFALAAAGVVAPSATQGAVAGTGLGAIAPAPAAPAPAGGHTPESWAGALLAELGDPASAENLRAIAAWERAEGGHWRNGARYNPLNTTQAMAGSWPINSVGVRAYASWSDGLRATVITLENGRYGGVLAQLRSGACAPCVADAVGASPWGTGRFAV